MATAVISCHKNRESLAFHTPLCRPLADASFPWPPPCSPSLSTNPHYYVGVKPCFQWSQVGLLLWIRKTNLIHTLNSNLHSTVYVLPAVMYKRTFVIPFQEAWTSQFDCPSMSSLQSVGSPAPSREASKPNNTRSYSTSTWIGLLLLSTVPRA